MNDDASAASDPDLDGRIAAMRMAGDILDGKSSEDFETYSLGRAGAIRGMGYAVGRWVQVCRQYAMLYSVADVPEEYTGVLEVTDPQVAAVIDQAVRNMVESALAGDMLSVLSGSLAAADPAQQDTSPP